MLRFLTKQGWVTCRHTHRALNPDLSAAQGLALFSALRHERQTGMHMSGNRTATLPLPTPFLPCLPATHEARGLASDASTNTGQKTQAKAIKTGLSAGTVPPATEQVPASVEQHQEAAPAATSSNSKTGSGSSSSQTVRSSAMIGKDRPSASAVPAGVDQVPPSMVSHTASQPSQGGLQSDDQDAPSTSAPQSQQSMQSVMADISDVGQLGKAQPGGNAPSAASNMQGISRWQRFKWWIWGTPQQYWKDQDGASSTGNISGSSKGESETSSSSTDVPGSSKEWKRSKYTLGDIIGSAILRSGITKDEDIARFASKSAAIAIYTLGGFSLLGTLGVDTKPLVAGLGVGGFTVGFALRDVATNFVSGVLLVLQRPFEKGNRLRVHAGSTVLEGEVQSIELRYIVLKPKDQSTIMIPASIVYANPVVVLKQ